LSTYKIEESESSLHNLDLNPDHTHFVLVDDNNVHLKLLKFRVALEKRLQMPIVMRKSKRAADLGSIPVVPPAPPLPIESAPQEDLSSRPRLPSTSEQQPANPNQNQERIPIVSLLIGGGVGSISLVLAKINQSTPVLVFKGTGHAPDLISGAYEDFADR
jgi:hypothetical protein